MQEHDKAKPMTDEQLREEIQTLYRDLARTLQANIFAGVVKEYERRLAVAEKTHAG